MDTVGKYLKNLRLQKSVSIEEVVRNTNIPRRYIEGIEKEDFSDFPGEVYIKGYIKSYTIFLGGDPDYALSLYEKKKIEEKDVPFEELIGKRSFFEKLDFRKIGVVLGILAVFVSLIVIVLVLVFYRGYEVVVDNNNVKTILKPFSEGEEFRDTVGDISVKIKLIEVRNNGNDIVLSINDSIYSFVLRNRSMMDFNMDGIVDMEIKYESFIDRKPRLRISFYKSQEKKSKQDSVFLENVTVPVEFEILSQDVVWVSLLIDNTEETQFYLNKDSSKKFSAKNKVVLKTSDIKNLKITAGGSSVPIKDEGPSYLVLELIEGLKGVVVNISYME
ncbi:MAG: helix-turn-helix domain-containing protein [Spirochaetes bacterium]|nr:helix-turn-helix domain-containing protein [Spirochaetota bacterium]